MKECDKRKSHINSKLHIIYKISNTVTHPVYHFQIILGTF